MTAVDVFVGNYTIVDFDIYDLWLSGYTANDAALNLQKKGVLQNTGYSSAELVSETQECYRLFVILEKMLKNPIKLVEQQIYQIDADTQKSLIERYYRFDAAVVREILGKKLSSRNRKDLDDVSEKTKVPLRSCRRQFDNVKRVFKTVEDMRGSLVKNIQTHYLLSDDPARQYAAIVFIANNRFDTGKKKLGYLLFDDFVHCAYQMIANWSYSATDSKEHEDMDVDLDREFLQELRELRILLDKENMDEQKSLVTRALQPIISKKLMLDLEENFKTYSKTIINIACGLIHSKEVRDLFVDLVEKVVEPCLQIKWAKEDLDLFLMAYKESFHKLESMRSNNTNLPRVWERYIITLSSCILKIYHT
ncbi:hypothetical protein ScPMuIL_014489 [Solemya velum]